MSFQHLPVVSSGRTSVTPSLPRRSCPPENDTYLSVVRWLYRVCMPSLVWCSPRVYLSYASHTSQLRFVGLCRDRSLESCPVSRDIRLQVPTESVPIRGRLYDLYIKAKPLISSEKQQLPVCVHYNPFL